MKKHLFLVAMAALAMASCSKDEQTDINPNRNGQAIDFRAAMGTRATETTVANLSSIYVTALKGTQTYFDQVNFTKSNGFFNSQDSYYWPGDDSELTFYAYAPSTTDLNATVTITSTDKKLTDFTPNTAIDKQVDFITADATGKKSTNEANGVELTFAHQLAQIGIAAKSSNTTYKYTVKGVKLVNILNMGTFEFSNAEWETKAWAQATTADLSEYVFTLAKDAQSQPQTSIVLTANLASLVDENAMLIPQQLVKLANVGTDPNKTVNNGAYIAVNITITTSATGATVHDGWVAAPIDTKWANGNKYIYQLDFSTGAGVDPTDPEEPILGSPIKFTVDVTEWNNADTPINM